MRKAALIIILVIIALIVIPQAIYTVDMTQQAIILQMGEYKKTVKEPGLHVKIPFIQSVVRFEKRVLTSDTAPAEYLTLDKKRLKVDHVSRWRVADPLLFYKSVRNEEGGLARLQPIVFSEMRDELARHNLSDIISVKREEIMRAVTARAREKIKEFGIELIDVRIKRADLPTEVQESVFARMRAERERKAKKYRAEGEEEAFKIRAEAEKQKTIILAEAYEESQKLKGEGDAEAIKIYAEAFKQDPEFYNFLRSLEAYEKFLVKKTTLVLGSDSELFKYLKSPQPKEFASPEVEAAPKPKLPAKSKPKMKFTEFYLLGPGGKAEGYPKELIMGEEGKVILGIRNHEHEEVSYRVEVRIGGERVKAKLKGKEVDQIGPISLKHEQKWEEEITFLPQKAGEQQKVDFLLYKGEALEPSSLLHIWINVREQEKLPGGSNGL